MSEKHQSARRPKQVWTLFGLLLFVGLTALGGGIEMVVFPDGNQFVSGDWLAHVPFDSWIIPGLVLGVGFGLGSLLAAYSIVSRPDWQILRSLPPSSLHWSWTLTVALGFGLAAWIALEVVMIPERSLIELLYGVMAVAVLLLAWSGPVQAYLRTPVKGRQNVSIP